MMLSSKDCLTTSNSDFSKVTYRLDAFEADYLLRTENIAECLISNLSYRNIS